MASVLLSPTAKGLRAIRSGTLEVLKGIGGFYDTNRKYDSGYIPHIWVLGHLGWVFGRLLPADGDAHAQLLHLQSLSSNI